MENKKKSIAQRPPKPRTKWVKKAEASAGTPKIVKLKLSELKPSDYNPRTITDSAMAGLANSLARFGCVEPIVINTRNGKNIIVGGNQRFAALKAAGVIECICVAVDLKPADEKLLNITLNNPHAQGKFADWVTEMIDKLSEDLTDKNLLLDLRINELQNDFGQAEQSKISYREENLKPYKRTHILLSFEPAKLADIHEQIEAILKTPGIEYEQCSN